MRRYRNDFLLAAVLLAAALAAFFLLRGARTSGAFVVVEWNGAEYARFLLSEDRTVVLSDGTHSNTLVISDGEAWVSASNCPDHLCERQGKKHSAGDMIVCLPNQLIIEIQGGSKQADQTIS